MQIASLDAFEQVVNNLLENVSCQPQNIVFWTLADKG